MKLQQEFVLYRNMAKPEIFEALCDLYETGQKEEKKHYERKFNELMSLLIANAERYGLSGNLVHLYLSYALINSENAFSLACERRKTGLPSRFPLRDLAMEDFKFFMALFSFDYTKELGENVRTNLFNDYNCNTLGKVPYPKEVRSAVNALSVSLGKAAKANNIKLFCEKLVAFYRHFGVGKLGLYKAFRMAEKAVQGGNTIVTLEQMTSCSNFTFDHIVGYKEQIAMLCENTENFIDGKSCNNVLLFGDSGTGKSSSIKACMNKYYAKGLRMIEVYKHQFQHLPDIIKSLKGRNYRFVIYMDDLSFEEFEIEYKYLKAVIEGGLEEKPDNVSIYATSNRRHLVKESYQDNEEKRNDELHGGDSIQEKLSLSARFGVTIYYGSPDKRQFENMVLELANNAGVTASKEEILREANVWELRHGMMSGRMASQFIAYMLGREGGK